MASEFRPIVINLLWISLFAVAILTAGYMVAIQNNASQSVLDDPSLASLNESLSTQLKSNYQTTTQAGASFENSSVSLTSGIPFINAIYGVWKVLKNAPITMYNLIVGVIFQKLLGDTATFIIISVISTILIITIIFAVVKLVSTGEGG